MCSSPYAISEELESGTYSPEEFTRRIRRLEKLACPFQEDWVAYETHMQTAKQMGMTYMEALEHAVRAWAGGAD